MGLVPIGDSPDEGGNQEDTRRATERRLGLAEDQGQVARDFFLLEFCRGADPFPGGGDLDQDAARVDAGFPVESNQPLGATHRAGGVERQTRVDLRRHVARHDPRQLGAEVDCEFVERQFDARVRCLFALRRIGDRLVHQRRVFGLAGGLENEAGIGRAVLRAGCLDLSDVTGIGDDDRVPGKRRELVFHPSNLSFTTNLPAALPSGEERGRTETLGARGLSGRRRSRARP